MYELEQGAVTRAVVDGVAVEIPCYDHERTRGADYSDPSQLPALKTSGRVLDGRAVHDGRRVVSSPRVVGPSQLSGDFCSCGGLQIWTGRCKTCQACGASGGCG